MVFVYLLHAWRGEKSWFNILFWVPWGMFLDGLRLLWTYLLLASSRIVTPKLGKIDTEVKFDTKLYEKFPVEHKIWPNPQCGLDETGDCDGEHLFVSNPLNIYGPMTSWLLIGWVGVFFIDNAIIATLLFVLSPFLATFIPNGTGVMFHRRAQTATFYRGLFGPPITVPFEQVSYASTLDPDGGASMFVIRAKVPRKDGNGTYYVRFRSFDPEYLRQRVGAIYAFMDQSNTHAISILAKESIEWHKKNNETLWRFTNKKRPSAEFDKHYQDDNSLYNLTDQLITPYSIRFGDIVNPDTREEGLNEEKRVREVSARVAAFQKHDAEYEAAKPMIAEFFAAQLDQRESKYSKANILPLVEKFEHEVNLYIHGIYSKIFNHSHSVFFSRIENTNTENRRKIIQQVQKAHDAFDLDSIEDASNLIDSFILINNLKEEYKESLIKRLLFPNDIKEIYSIFTTNERFKEGILADYDWQKYAEGSVAEICAAAEHEKQEAVNE